MAVAGSQRKTFNLRLLSSIIQLAKPRGFSMAVYCRCSACLPLVSRWLSARVKTRGTAAVREVGFHLRVLLGASLGMPDVTSSSKKNTACSDTAMPIICSAFPAVAPDSRRRHVEGRGELYMHVERR